MDKLMVLNTKAGGTILSSKLMKGAMHAFCFTSVKRVGRSWMMDEDPFLPGIKPYKEDKWCPHCITEEWVLGVKSFNRK